MIPPSGCIAATFGSSSAGRPVNRCHPPSARVSAAMPRIQPEARCQCRSQTAVTVTTKHSHTRRQAPSLVTITLPHNCQHKPHKMCADRRSCQRPLLLCVCCAARCPLSLFSLLNFQSKKMTHFFQGCARRGAVLFGA